MICSKQDNILDANINYEYALKDAVKAHEAIESGTIIYATVLIFCKQTIDHDQWTTVNGKTNQSWGCCFFHFNMS